MRKTLLSLLTASGLFAEGMTPTEVARYVDSLGFPSSYYKTSGKARKKAFVEVLLPKIQAENKRLLELQSKLLDILHRPKERWSDKEHYLIHSTQKEYRIKSLTPEAIQRKIAPIPVSLALAQAALESGWGQSRFVRQANNIFGHWTYGKLGLVPASRDEGKTHKVKVYKNLDASIAGYMRNLNRNPAYKAFRAMRFNAMKNHALFSGVEASLGMKAYSGIGMEYIHILKAMIHSNQFHQFDEHYYEKIIIEEEKKEPCFGWFCRELETPKFIRLPQASSLDNQQLKVQSPR